MANAGLGTPYWYEWEIGLIECLKMMNDLDIESVVLQSSHFQSLDDVVVNYKDKSMINIQVKHTDVNDNFTYSFLSSGEKSLLKKLATEWKREKSNHNIREIQIVTNKKWGTHISDRKCSMYDFVTKVYPKMKKDFSYCGENELENNAVNWFKNELNFLGDESEKFVKVLSFRAESSLIETDKLIRKLVAEIIGTDKEDAVEHCVNNILAALSIWATSRRTKQEITREDVYQALCALEYDVPRYELYPEKPIFPSRERFSIEFLKKINKNEKKIIFLEGFPGAGKTNFVSYLSQMDDSIVDFRYYTYLPVSRDDASYSDDEGYYSGQLLWLSILTQMKKKFEELKMLSTVEFPIIYRYLSVSEMRRYALKYLPIYSQKIGRTCYFFIDGVDHAARSYDARNSFLMQIPQPEEIGEGVKFILIGQPVNDKYPSWLMNNPDIDYMFLPSLEVDDISELLSQNKIVMNGIDIESLSDTIISVVGSNALNVIFAMLELKKMSLPLSFEMVENILRDRCLNCQIDKYYEWIENSMDKSLLFYKLEAIFAYSSRKNTLHDLALLCGSSEGDTQFVLNKLYPLVLRDEVGYYTFHNDVRLHFQNGIKANSNYKSITQSLYHNILMTEELEVYRYDILFDLLLNLDNTGKMFELIDVKYIIASVKYNISLNMLSKQLLYVLKLLVRKKDFNYLNKASAVSLTLSQFANCIQYYEKESLYIEHQRGLYKTKSEKYVLDSQVCIEQIVRDIHYLLKNEQFDRGIKVFDEYLAEKGLKELLTIDPEDNKDFHKHLGYIYRQIKPTIINQDCDNNKHYADFVDGWLEASVNFLTPEEMKRTFSYKSFYPESLYEYITKVSERSFNDEEAYRLLKQALMHDSTPISVLIELCVLGTINGHDNSELIEYIYGHLDDLLSDSTYQFNSDRILGCVKALFCIYSRCDYIELDKIYMDILKKCRIDEMARGYTPAMVQKEMAHKVFDIYYGFDRSDSISDDIIYNFIYFPDRYGLGSSHDCNAYKVLSFLRKIFVCYAKGDSTNGRVTKMCEGIVNSMSWEKTRHISDFDMLFYYVGEQSKFLEVAHFWCGYNGAIWNQEYSEVEYCCTSIMSVLDAFGQHGLCDEIAKRKAFKLFGYVGRKDYSLMNLLDLYKCIPLSENKLLKEGMRLLSISDAASDIGDNRISMDIVRELFGVATALGIKYANALFELKNKPGKLNYWRDMLLTIFYEKIDFIKDDEELMALYRLTNAWINAYFESFRQYGRMNTLKEYNSIILSKITDKEMRKEIEQAGNCDIDKSGNVIEPTVKYDVSEIISLVETTGYSESFENLVCKAITEKSGGTFKLLTKLKKIIPEEHLFRFADNCVLKYILLESEYGFSYTGTRDILELYREYLSENSWIDIFESIVSRISETEIDGIYRAGTDIGTYTLNYLMCFKPECVKDAFVEMCNTHELFISANGLLTYHTYELDVDHNITSLQEMVKLHLGCVSNRIT
ncbi:MAG: hypothetical protein IJZ53_12220 [Tyzzerella sp.]|nr:hypothetical protein [Tyzzerella sp.]